MSKLRNWRWEKFAQEIAAGGDVREAYTIAGYKPDRANHNRLLRRADVSCRIDELKRDRVDAARSAGMTPLAARAAGMSAPAVLAALTACGIERLDEFFEPGEGGVLRVSRSPSRAS
jgi:hypothetical protein